MPMTWYLERAVGYSWVLLGLLELGVSALLRLLALFSVVLSDFSLDFVFLMTRQSLTFFLYHFTLCHFKRFLFLGVFLLIFLFFSK